MGKLLALFVIMPIAEITILLNVGEHIGGWNTVGLVLLTAVFGATLVRQQGLSTFMQAQQKMQQGNMPGQEMAEGLLLVIAGVLLVTPGFITDAIGFLFSLPVTRPVIARTLIKHLSVNVVSGQQGFHRQQYQQHQQWQHTASHTQQDDVIEGEFERKDQDRHTGDKQIPGPDGR